jgi:hypothetical protein
MLLPSRPASALAIVPVLADTSTAAPTWSLPHLAPAETVRELSRVAEADVDVVVADAPSPVVTDACVSILIVRREKV